MDERKTLVEVKNLTKKYGSGEGTTIALNNLSMSIYKSELLVILGSSGSGKSTLLNLLGGMDKPNSGSIFINGKNLCRMNDHELTRYRREQIGFVFQNFNLIPELTAKENVSLICSEREYVWKSLKMVGMGSKMNKYPSQLSGGEQQRVSIARAISRRPSLLLCDEPTGALDYRTGRQILITLERFCRDYGMTVVFVTHTREIGRMADRVLYMRSGEIQEEIEIENPVSAEMIEW